MLFVLICVVFLNGCPPAQLPESVNAFRVDKNTPAPEENQDGLTWATAFNEIQEGIDASEASGGGEVWVVTGWYNEIRNDEGGDAGHEIRIITTGINFKAGGHKNTDPCPHGIQLPHVTKITKISQP